MFKFIAQLFKKKVPAPSPVRPASSEHLPPEKVARIEFKSSATKHEAYFHKHTMAKELFDAIVASAKDDDVHEDGGVYSLTYISIIGTTERIREVLYFNHMPEDVGRTFREYRIKFWKDVEEMWKASKTGGQPSEDHL